VSEYQPAPSGEDNEIAKILRISDRTNKPMRTRRTEGIVKCHEGLRV